MCPEKQNCAKKTDNLSFYEDMRLSYTICESMSPQRPRPAPRPPPHQELNELFNVAGDKLSILEKLLRKEQRRVNATVDPPPRIKMAETRTITLLKEKRGKLLRDRMIDSRMSSTTKMSIIGEETRLRRDLTLGFPVNSRDICVSFVYK
jgi:hypothetical protein